VLQYFNTGKANSNRWVVFGSFRIPIVVIDSEKSRGIDVKSIRIGMSFWDLISLRVNDSRRANDELKENDKRK